MQHFCRPQCQQIYSIHQIITYPVHHILPSASLTKTYFRCCLLHNVQLRNKTYFVTPTITPRECSCLHQNPSRRREKKISISCPLIIKLRLQPTQICHSEKTPQPQHHLCQKNREYCILQLHKFNFPFLACILAELPS